MNVSQLEAALDLPRASIRFYEKEGLLSPERLANGYRDYSEADLETLRRIKLLRALGLPLEDIKALQAGELRLSDALRAQEERLRREAAEREAARTLCRAMELEGAEYKRPKAAPSPLLAPWYAKKSFSLCQEGEHCDLLWSHDLVDALVEGYEFLLPYYQYMELLEGDPDPRGE